MNKRENKSLALIFFLLKLKKGRLITDNYEKRQKFKIEWLT